MYFIYPMSILTYISWRGVSQNIMILKRVYKEFNIVMPLIVDVKTYKRKVLLCFCWEWFVACCCRLVLEMRAAFLAVFVHL